MAQFRADYPGIALRLHDVVSDRCLDMIAQGEVDLGLNAQPGNEREFESTKLFDERLYVVCPSSDALAERTELRLRDLRGREFIHTVRSGSVWQQTQPMLRDIGVRDSGLEVAQFGTLAGLIAAGFGISLVPQFAVPLCTAPGIAAVLVADRKAVRPIYMVKRRHRSLSTAAADMWQRLSQSAAV
jgi:DNA-binding transcriptional LysR family regulator